MWELSTLDFLKNLFSSVLGDSIKERIKPKGSSEIAKKRVLRLYKALGKVNQSINNFVTTLEGFSSWVQENTPEIDLHEKRLSLPDRFNRWIRGKSTTQSGNNSLDDLKKSAQSLLDSLEELSNALDSLNPQLEIHQPNLWRYIINLTEDDSIIVDRTRRFIPMFRSFYSKNQLSHKDERVLSEIVNRAVLNRKLLNKVIEDYRAFISEEFGFKESF